MMEQMIRMGAFEPRSLVNGPGARAVLWVQGCGRRCPGCFNPEFLSREGGRLVPAEEVIQWIRDAVAGLARIFHTLRETPTGCEVGRAACLSDGRQVPSAPLSLSRRGEDTAPYQTCEKSGLEGVTFSGGEPFDQASGLAIVARAAREMGLGVLVFTGYPWEDLQRRTDAGQRALIEAADMLVAGPYEHEHPCTHSLLSSTNQRLVFLTDRYRAHNLGQKRRVEFRIASDGTVRITGFPTYHYTMNPRVILTTASHEKGRARCPHRAEAKPVLDPLIQRRGEDTAPYL